MAVDKTPANIIHNYCCEKCNFSCVRLSEWKRHINRIKHNRDENDANDPSIKSIKCKCGLIYKYTTGYYRHLKTCSFSNYTDNNDRGDTELVNYLLKENCELKTMIIDVCKTMKPTTVNNNSHNKTFNLNFFLNEQCKDALNINDFVNLIKPSIRDLEHTGKVGYIAGISQLIINNLEGLEETHRPMHCSDIKREIMYIKDNE